MSEFTIDSATGHIQRDGKPAKVYGLTPDGKKLVIALESEGQWYISSRWPDGRELRDVLCGSDIINAPAPKVKVWVFTGNTPAGDCVVVAQLTRDAAEASRTMAAKSCFTNVSPIHETEVPQS